MINHVISANVMFAADALSPNKNSNVSFHIRSNLSNVLRIQESNITNKVSLVESQHLFFKRNNLKNTQKSI